ncbi:hypothetical protein BDN72DRAFT_905456 [Pluteus cervinus]|uniref:Uncharacterized protein n=1 Tax=Pluteus cervinus TaxID=181527 RepID=A0ACD3A2C7_9AGAR|nr:hypothetical protein BDN72DRAFT_905456 [Pluteus cervinus]
MHPLQARLDRYTSRLRAALTHYHSHRETLEPYSTWYHTQAIADLREIFSLIGQYSAVLGTSARVSPFVQVFTNILKPEEPSYGGFQITNNEARDLATGSIDPETRIVDKYKTDWWLRPGSIYQAFEQQINIQYSPARSIKKEFRDRIMKERGECLRRASEARAREKCYKDCMGILEELITKWESHLKHRKQQDVEGVREALEGIDIKQSEGSGNGEDIDGVNKDDQLMTSVSSFGLGSRSASGEDNDNDNNEGDIEDSEESEDSSEDSDD